MKKILFVFALCFLFISCNEYDKDIEDKTPVVTISFDHKLVSSNSMTRSEGNEFLDIIEKQTSDYIDVTLKNLDLNKTYTCKSNETITIPIGNYEISGIYNAHAVGGSNVDIYEAPCLKCNKFAINITSKNNNITLNVYYNCYVVFALIDECKDCEVKYNDQSHPTLCKYGKYFYGYFKDEQQYMHDDNINIMITPYDDSTEFITTTYVFSTTYNINKVFAEYGKYYVVHPQKVDKTTSSFNMNLEKMEEGEI